MNSPVMFAFLCVFCGNGPDRRMEGAVRRLGMPLPFIAASPTHLIRILMRWARHQVIPVVPVNVSLTTYLSPNGRSSCLGKTSLGRRREIRNARGLLL